MSSVFGMGVHEFYSLKGSQMSELRASSHEYPDVEKIKLDLKFFGFDLSHVPVFKLGTRRCWHENHLKRCYKEQARIGSPYCNKKSKSPFLERKVFF